MLKMYLEVRNKFKLIIQPDQDFDKMTFCGELSMHFVWEV